METSKMTVLVVDDLAENIDILATILGSQYQVKVALNGSRAIKIAQGTPPPDLILLDIMMPEMNGYEVAEILKKDAATKEIPIIFVTAMNELEDEQKGLEHGAVDYIAKPVHPPIVRARVRNQMELKMHRDHLEEMVTKRTMDLELTRDVTILTLASLAETRDDDTGGHIRRTQNYVKILAQALKANVKYADSLDATTIDLMYKSAPLHDVGKVGVPDAILLKPGKLDPDEFEEMKKHTILGRDTILRAEESMQNKDISGFLRFAKEIAYTHHEKWDGSGYPQGLKGEEIPLSGRIMAVADVYDALTSRRVYKLAFSHEQACTLLYEGRGTLFDPDVIDAFNANEARFRKVALKYADHQEERIAVNSN